MIINSGFRGASRIRSPRSMRGFHINGFGASYGFGDDSVNPTMVFDDQGNVTYVNENTDTSSSGSNIGTAAAGIGSGLKDLATGIATLFGAAKNPSTQGGYGSPMAANNSMTISPSTMVLLGVLGIGAVVLLSKK